MQTSRGPKKRQVTPRRLLFAVVGFLGILACDVNEVHPPPKCSYSLPQKCFPDDAGTDAGEELLDGGESPDTDGGEDSDGGTPDAG